VKDNNLIKREFDIPSHSRHLAEVRQEVENAEALTNPIYTKLR